MNKEIENMINIFFSLLTEAVNDKIPTNERIFYYKFQGILEALFTANILTSEERDYLFDASWEVYYS